MKCVFCGQKIDRHDQAMLAWWSETDGTIVASGAYHNGRNTRLGCQGAAENTGYALLDMNAENVGWEDIARVILQYPKWEDKALQHFLMAGSDIIRSACT